MCPGVVQRHLPVVGEQVPCRAVVDGDGDEAVPVEAPSSVAHAGEKDSQVVGLSIEFVIERGDGFVVELGGRCAGVRVIEVEDGVRPSRSQGESGRSRWDGERCRWCREHWRSGSGGRLRRRCRHGWLSRRSRLPLVHVALRRKCCWCSASSLCSCLYDGRSLSSRAEEACYFSTSVP